MKYKIFSTHIGYTPIHLVDYKLKNVWVALAAFSTRQEAENYVKKDPVIA